MYQDLTALTDAQLVASLKSLVVDERKCLVAILRHLREMDRRRIATDSGYPSLFDYCVREFRYAHGATARLIHASRAAAKYPVIYRALARGLLSLTTVSMLAPHLTRQNYRALLRSSLGRTTREVEVLIASLNPLPAAPVDRVRFLAVAAPVPPGDIQDFFTEPAITEQPLVAASPAPSAPPAPAIRLVHFSFTGDAALWRDYERAKELSRHKWPAGKMEDVFSGAMKALLDKIDPDRRRRRKDRARRIAAGTRSRYIARAVKDEVWLRDGGRCGYPGEGGRVCGARAGLQFDHVKPWALGGGGGADNVRLLCRAHNDLEARKAFGSGVIDAAISRRRGRLAEGAENI